MTTATLLENKELVEKYLRQSSLQLSSFSFTNIFTWQEFFQFEFEIIDQNLCVFARHEAGTFLYLPPLGKNVSVKTIQTCFEKMNAVNRHKGVSRIENVPQQLLPSFPADKFKHYNKGHEYCYYRKDIAELTGTPYKSKRSSYNQFVANNTFKYRPYEDAMFEECAQVYQNWAQDRGQRYADNMVHVQMLEENAGVHSLGLRHHRELGLVGRVVLVDGKIRAYTFGYPLNPEIFCILFEVADLSFNGLGVFIFREFCRDAAVAPYKFINAMDDFELKNIESTKMSYHPAVLLPSYTIYEYFIN